MTNRVLDKAQKAITVGTALATLLRIRGEFNDKTGQWDKVTALGFIPVWKRENGRPYLFLIPLKR